MDISTDAMTAAVTSDAPKNISVAIDNVSTYIPTRTDATIVSHYSPFVTLGWVVSGLDTGGNRVLDETLTREEALLAHTRSNAYLFFQENALGSLEVGMCEVSSVEVGTNEVGSPEVGFAEAGTAEVGFPEVGIAKVGTTEIGLYV